MAKKKKVSSGSKAAGSKAIKKSASQQGKKKAAKKSVVKKKTQVTKKTQKKSSPKSAPKVAAKKAPISKSPKKKGASDNSSKKKAVGAKSTTKKNTSEKSVTKKLESKATKASELKNKSQIKSESKVDQKTKLKTEKKSKAAESAPTSKHKSAKNESSLRSPAKDTFVEDISSIEIEEVYEEEVLLTDAEGNVICRLSDCDQAAQVDGYCRYHYLLFWKKIQSRKKILSEGKLERYIEELTARYPDKFLDVLKKDLKSQKEFLAAIQELEIDESDENGDFEEEDTQNYIDEIRGVGDAVGTSRDEDDF